MLPHMCNNRGIPPGDSDCKGSIHSMARTSFLLLLLLFVVFTTIRSTEKVNILFVNSSAPIIFQTDQKFISVGLDSSVIASGFKNFNMSDPKLIKIIRHLSPAYLRVGGNMADRLIFTSDNETMLKDIKYEMPDGGDCSNSAMFCDFQDKQNFTMNGLEWLKLNNLTKNTNLSMVFDLNVLRRSQNDSWNSSNAEELISFSSQHKLNIDWQLGNEPNAFRHQFNYEVNATQLASDFRKLKTILRKYPQYAESLLIGPDTTRPDPKHRESIRYMAKFLEDARSIIDVISWHHYYFNGRTVGIGDFLDPNIFDILIWQIDVIHTLQNWTHVEKKPVWLAETASAWGGGSPKYSDKFVACFIWLDKLGLTAKFGIDVVVRQSIFNGHYALISDDFKPNPDYWISILYKKFVGPEVLSCHNVATKLVRLYCQCTRKGAYFGEFSAITVYGMNMQSTTAKVRIQGLFPIEQQSNLSMRLLSYTLTAKNSLTDNDVYLNGIKLELTKDDEIPKFIPKIENPVPYIVMPPYSIVFWVIPVKTKICG